MVFYAILAERQIMRTKAPMTYEDIYNLQQIVMDADSPYEKTNYQNMLFSYCWQAIDYVDMMTEHGSKADFTMESLLGMIPAVVYMITDEDKAEGDSTIEKLASVKELMAGYLMFTLYNRHLAAGNTVRYKMNEFGNGMSLVVSNHEKGLYKVIDIMESLDWAFCAIDFDELDEIEEEEEEEERIELSFNIPAFFKALLDN